ncbi:dihydroorotate dehydrogenase [Striga asiatica]|uniref:Dihydroorotate dehydrogenase n=1 Tax=Striga asiatica TaxID=4170 RepID=A0A5A7PTI2_STRAF|nr:dihydroorotate dehydrogenase [Striga asiatica]
MLLLPQEGTFITTFTLPMITGTRYNAKLRTVKLDFNFIFAGLGRERKSNGGASPIVVKLHPSMKWELANRAVEAENPTNIDRRGVRGSVDGVIVMLARFVSES